LGEAALKEFDEGVRRSIKQYETGQVGSFKTKNEFLNHLRRL
jgi:hypothetical protein